MRFCPEVNQLVLRSVRVYRGGIGREIQLCHIALGFAMFVFIKTHIRMYSLVLYILNDE